MSLFDPKTHQFTDAGKDILNEFSDALRSVFEAHKDCSPRELSHIATRAAVDHELMAVISANYPSFTESDL